jgi:16S rRNA (cytosine967-C5)-methyltransferase
MSRFYSYLNSAKEILSLYKGEEPFASFLKKYFNQHKKFGSKDRKQVSHLCYCYFRLGKSAAGNNMEERILIALFLCSGDTNEILQLLKPRWNEYILKSPGEKLSMLLGEGYNHDILNNIFPWEEKLSNSISHADFSKSFLVQPDLFLRLRPGHEIEVKEKLRVSNIELAFNGDNTVGIANTVSVEGVIRLDSDAVIQDLSSQKTGDL